jgi:hypothetical protein
VTSLLFKPAPWTVAFDALASHCKDVMCCALSPPPPDLLPRMFVILTGVLRRLERPSAIRSSCPPPSNVVPSRWIGFPILVGVIVVGDS